MTLGDWLAYWLPEQCPACAGPTAAGFCAGCRAELAVSPGVLSPQPLRVHAPLSFEPPLDHYVHALKFRGARRLGRALGLLLADTVRERRGDVDAIVPVPLHRARLRARGYNQAVEIALPIARAIGAPLLLRGIERRLPTAPQTGLGAEARARNLRGAFAVARPLEGLRLAIVDDVLTTGATAAALAAELHARGAAAVEAWTVAHTPPHRARAAPNEESSPVRRAAASGPVVPRP